MDMRGVIRGACLLLTLTVAGVAGAGPQAGPGGKDPGLKMVREQLADILAGEDFDKVEFSAATFDRAMEWIYTTVDTFLEGAVPLLGSAADAGEYGKEILAGLEDHTVHWADDNGLDLVGKRRLVVGSGEEARELGEVLLRTAELIHEAQVGRGVAIRSAARKVFETMLPVQGNGQSLVTQYVVRLRTLTRPERKELVRLLEE